MNKLIVGDGEFLKPINEVQLNSSFGQSLNDELDKINDNFRKLISVPFLKGEHGENIQLISIPLFDENNELTLLGQAVFSAIYGGNITDLGSDIDNNIGGSIQEHNSYDSMMLDENRKIAFYGYVKRTPMSEKIIITSQQVYIFVDARVAHIENIDEEQLTVFEDMSCALTISGEILVDSETGEVLVDDESTVYNVVKYNIIPTLYYDDTEGINEWCWKINGAKSKISAQGLKGDNGSDASCVVCKGTMEPSAITNAPYDVKIENVLTPDGWTSTDSLYDGQIAVVWYKSANNSLNCTLGNVVVSQDQPKIYVGHDPENSPYLNYDFLTAFGNIQLREALNDICNTESTNDYEASDLSCRGLWILDKYVQSPQSANPVHMIWSNNNNDKIVHFGLSNYGSTYGNVTPNSDKQWSDSNQNSKLEFHYDTIEKDYISARRQDNIPSHTYSEPEIGRATFSAPNITSHNVTNTVSAPQSIRITDENGNNIRSQISSNGLYLCGNENEKIYSIELNLEKVVMSSNVNIDTTDIYINSNTQPSYQLSSLYADDNLDNLINDPKVHVNKQNLVVTNANLIVGGSKVYDGLLNAYTQHYKNHSIYNFDPNIILLSAGIGDVYVNYNRPRMIGLVPVSIGGWLTIYNTRNDSVITDPSIQSEPTCYPGNKCKPIEITPEENFKHTFLSGKFGWSNKIYVEKNVSDPIVYNSLIKEFFYIDTSTIKSTKYCLSTSLSGIWTKIGNVVDVKGKIFFYGVKANDTLLGSVQYDYYPITYSSLFDFINKNLNCIEFPLPIVMRNSANSDTNTRKQSYAYTGNVIMPDDTLTQINENTGIDLHFGNSSIQNSIVSNPVGVNEILNGAATFHFFGNTEKTLNYNKDSSVHNVSFTDTEIECLPNIFSCTANIKLSSENNPKTWTLFALPNKEILNIPVDGSSISNIENNVGPVRFANQYKSGELDGEKVIHPANIDDYVISAQPYGHGIFEPSAIHLNTVTTISPYIVRYVTFQFSYLLNDDTYQNDIYCYDPNWDNGNVLHDSKPWDTSYEDTLSLDLDDVSLSINNSTIPSTPIDNNDAGNSSENQNADESETGEDNPNGNDLPDSPGNSGNGSTGLEVEIDPGNGGTEEPDDPTVKP